MDCNSSVGGFASGEGCDELVYIGDIDLDNVIFNGNYTGTTSSAGSIGGANSDLSSDIVAGVHQGMKGLTGLGNVAIYDGTNAYKTIDMGTTNMYYDINALMNKVVTITNEGDPYISLSNVKITHK